MKKQTKKLNRFGYSAPASGICVLARGADNLGQVKYNTGESRLCVVPQVSPTFSRRFETKPGPARERRSGETNPPPPSLTKQGENCGRSDDRAPGEVDSHSSPLICPAQTPLLRGSKSFQSENGLAQKAVLIQKRGGGGTHKQLSNHQSE